MFVYAQAEQLIAAQVLRKEKHEAHFANYGHSYSIINDHNLQNEDHVCLFSDFYATGHGGGFNLQGSLQGGGERPLRFRVPPIRTMLISSVEHWKTST